MTAIMSKIFSNFTYSLVYHCIYLLLCRNFCSKCNCHWLIKTSWI